MIALRVDRCWRVAILGEAEVPLPAGRAWEHVRRLAVFATLDPFHGRISIEGGEPRPGAALRIEHGYGPIRVVRVGRLLRWQEGVGYAFSDLSRRGARVGFPHVYSYRVAAAGPSACRLSLGVRGRWTARAWPRWLVKLWLGWIMLMALHMMRNHLLLADLRRRAGLTRYNLPSLPKDPP